MAWNTQNIEVELEKGLKKKYKRTLTEATKYLGYYTYARDILVAEKIYDDIKLIQKGLSDHGENHVMNVLDNAYKLLGNDLKQMDALQLYFICMLILFHDVGNLTTDRIKHHEQDVIREIYDYVRDKKKEFEEERVLIPEVASKHSGHASDGSVDPIKELSTLPPFLFGAEIHTKYCAGLLRLADELAEGPHRTSTFMNKYYGYPYPEKSVIYHKYAEIARVNIDRRNERICLTYTFSINAIDGVISEGEHHSFSELFTFTIQRMLKLEAERKYCKYYCRWLEPFKKTHIIFNFIIENKTDGKVRSIRIQPDNSELVLDDLTLPMGISSATFLKERSSFEPENIFQSIKAALNEK